MSAGVGRAAGVDVPIEPGQIHIDHKRGTTWVSDADWLSFRDSPKGEGIAGILGGADNDDALWLHPFTDHDGAWKVLAWCSPNQAGEYVLLEPTAASRITGVWFNWLRTQNAGNGRPLPERMQDVPNSGQRMAKERIAHLAKTQFPGMRLRVTEEGGRLVAFTERGNLFGYLKGAEGVRPGDEIELGVSTTKDGNMRVQYRRAQTQGAS